MFNGLPGRLDIARPGLMVIATLAILANCDDVCPVGTTQVGDRCKTVMEAGVSGTSGAQTSASTATIDGAVSNEASTSQSVAGTGGTADTPGTQVGPASGNPSVAGAAATAGVGASIDTSSSGAQGSQSASTSCTTAGAIRCAIDMQGAIEACISGTWTMAQACAAGEVCTTGAGGQVACAASSVQCTGHMCNGQCVPNDEKNCGECGHDCTQLANVSGLTMCEAGACVVPPTSCETGYGHCTSRADDGCETKLSTEMNCGSCGKKCPEEAPVCSKTKDGSSYECTTGCSTTDAPALCGKSCVNTAKDPAHCGECGAECERVEFGQPVCMDGKCGKKCNSGYHLCGDKCVYDKAPESCGPTACEPCPTPPNSRATCDGSRCGFECSSSAYMKCQQGCVPSDDQNCGSCGNNCTASGKKCDGRGSCVGCLTSNDCRGSARYCVRNECKACDPGGANTCGPCQTCSSSGTCVPAAAGTDPGNDCDATSTGSECYDGQCDGRGACRTLPGITCYRDSDGDGYGAKAGSQHACGSSCSPGYVTNSDDCYDSNPDARPAQAAYFEVSRGDGSFDYNCDGRESPLNPDWKTADCASTCSGTCAPRAGATATPCGQRPRECPANPCPTEGTCAAFDGWQPQTCR